MIYFVQLATIGSVAGIIVGLFGIGGGLVIAPALVYWLKFTQHQAIGTSLAVLLPPVGVLAALEYYRHGNTDIKAALIIALFMGLAAYLGAYFTNFVNANLFRLIFGVFLVAIGIYQIITTYLKMIS
ncbi:MAG: sulfite exporter TauE/SafE family protein [SAR324 cluster bacterium]|nr:sulfite exporter TauE/SafE family protein [SAR324 cluster bacterium]